LAISLLNLFGFFRRVRRTFSPSLGVMTLAMGLL
jgi:hypothetical protein